MTQIRLDEVYWAGDFPLAHVATRVLELTGESSTSASALGQEIFRDQTLVTPVLRLANSDSYGVRGTVASVSRGIFLLGFNTVRSMAITICTQALYRRPTSGFRDQLLWEHALGTAAINRLIATDCAYPAGEEAFIAGLVHDVGKVVMYAKLGDRYEKVIAQVYNAEAESFVEAERAMFGFDHTEVGFLVATRWGLPTATAELVRCHHDPASAVADRQLCAIVSMTNAICIKLGLGPHQRPDSDLAAQSANKLLGFTPDQLDELLARAAPCAAAELEPYGLVWTSQGDGARRVP